MRISVNGIGSIVSILRLKMEGQLDPGVLGVLAVAFAGVLAVAYSWRPDG